MLPDALPMGPLLLSCLAVSALVLCDFRDFRPGRYLFKPLAAAAFIWLALSGGVPQSGYGVWLLAGLCCCLLGDVLLMPDKEAAFLAGVGAFLCGHLCYAMAFLQWPVNLTGLAVTALPALVLLVAAIRWFGPHLPATMKLPVILYTVVITIMLLCAGLTWGQALAKLVILGAWGFAISDLAVARRQFVSPGPWNGVWGTPLYFGSQMLLASTLVLGSGV